MKNCNILKENLEMTRRLKRKLETDKKFYKKNTIKGTWQEALVSGYEKYLNYLENCTPYTRLWCSLHLDYEISEKERIRLRENASAKKWRTNNHEKYNEIMRRRQLKNKNIIHAFTIEEWVEKKGETNGICPFCKTFVGIEKLTLDHIFPVSKAEEGRIYTIDDVQPLCNSCNIRKFNKIGDEYTKNP